MDLFELIVDKVNDTLIINYLENNYVDLTLVKDDKTLLYMACKLKRKEIAYKYYILC
jgi:hypothetical protein